MYEELFGKLSVIAMKGCEAFAAEVDSYLRDSRKTTESFLIRADCPRFGTGEGKGLIYETLRGHDVYIISDVFNYGVKYKMYGVEVPMSPDDHFADLKRIIGAIGGKAHRISVIMPMLYEGRQHRRSARESLDCALALQELVSIGVSSIITFDAHDSRVQNAIPLACFEDVRTVYQMIKAILRAVPELSFDRDKIMIVSPDEGSMHRCMYYSSVLGIDLGMFYKRRDYTRVVDGRNPIEAHEYLGRSIKGKDVIVVDDMLSSGDSVIDVAEQLKAKGANHIYVFCTFGLFSAGLAKLDKAYEQGLFTKIFTTNLIYQPDELLKREWYYSVNLCKYTAYIIDTLNHDRSMSELLDPVGRIHSLLDRYFPEKRSLTEIR